MPYLPFYMAVNTREISQCWRRYMPNSNVSYALYRGNIIATSYYCVLSLTKNPVQLLFIFLSLWMLKMPPNFNFLGFHGDLGRFLFYFQPMTHFSYWHIFQLIYIPNLIMSIFVFLHWTKQTQSYQINQPRIKEKKIREE